LALAAEALEQGEFPIAAVVVLDDEIIAQATLPSSVRSASWATPSWLPWKRLTSSNSSRGMSPGTSPVPCATGQRP